MTASTRSWMMHWRASGIGAGRFSESGASPPPARARAYAWCVWLPRRHLWTHQIALALRITHDISPEFCDALASLRDSVVRACAALCLCVCTHGEPFRTAAAPYRFASMMR